MSFLFVAIASSSEAHPSAFCKRRKAAGFARQGEPPPEAVIHRKSNFGQNRVKLFVIELFSCSIPPSHRNCFPSSAGSRRSAKTSRSLWLVRISGKFV